MNHIPTTATAVQKLKRQAKARRKGTGESLAAALDAAAREAGYSSWKHVTVCQESTPQQASSRQMLPEAIASFLSEHRTARPAGPELLEALQKGLLFAMDVKDAENVNPEGHGHIEECEDARAYLGGDIWTALLRRELEDRADQAQHASSDEDVLQEFFDGLSDYRFFRYSASSPPRSLSDAFATVFRDFFFSPTHVWLEGKFFDMADVREVHVDGHVVYSTSPASQPTAPHESAGESAEVKQPTDGGMSSSRDRRPFIARLDVRKWESGSYKYIVSYSSRELFPEAGFASIGDALKSASESEGDLAGFEVSYAGYVVGTYAADVLRATAYEVAQRAVNTASSLRRP